MRSVLILAGMLAATTAYAVPSLHIPAPVMQRAAPLEGSVRRPVLRVAEAVPVTLDVAQGAWTVHDDGSATWALRLDTDHATHLGVMLADVELPPGAQVLLESAEPDPLQIDARRDAQGRMWLPARSGPSAVLRIVVPDAANMYALRLGKAEVHYGTRSIDARFSQVGESDSCNVNVVCPQGNGWDVAIGATARLLIGNRRLCSGVLVNNTAEDGDPLLLTADHCGISEDGDFPLESVVVRLNFQSSRCPINTNISPCSDIAATALLYRDATSDTALLRIAAIPVNCPHALSGWDTRSVAAGGGADSGAGVHHPRGDVKKISLFSESVTQARVDISEPSEPPIPVDAWRVPFWSSGITERGSSGSGLWNQEQRVIGVLSGGSASCDNPDSPDFYGRLNVAWNRSGAPQNQPLRAFLDPADNGTLVLDALGSDGGNGDGGGTGGGSGGSTDDETGNRSGGSGGMLMLLFAVALRRALCRGGRNTL